MKIKKYISWESYDSILYQPVSLPPLSLFLSLSLSHSLLCIYYDWDTLLKTKYS